MELHAVMVTFPLRSHIYPLLHFAKALAAHHNVTVTFVNNPFFHNHALVREALSSPSNGKLRFECVEDGLPSDFDFNDVWPRHDEFLQGCKNMHASLQALLENLNQKHPPVSCVIFGSFFIWGHHAAMSLGIPSVFFWSQSATVFSIYRHLPLLATNGFFPYKNTPLEGQEDDARLVSYIPGIQSLYPEEFPTFLRTEDTNDQILIRFGEQFNTLKNCNAVVINSFHELEKETLEALQAELLPVFAVGPLLSLKQTSFSSNDDAVLESAEAVERDECLKWLDKQRSHSVLYVSFGSLSNPTPENIEGIALALKERRQPFIWAIQKRSTHTLPSSMATKPGVAEVLPKRFLDETSEYGIVIPWAPQLQVLGHPSVGAFLTHCGWNSTLESLSMGMPLITLPSFSDQTTNAKYIVDVWKVGMKVTVNESGNVDSADLVRVLNNIFGTEQGAELRKRAVLLKQAAGRALEIGSNSEISKFCSIFMSPSP